jgi:hypothetical protein
MTRISNLQDIDLWEVWIEFDHLNSGYFGVLYVMGELEVNKKVRHPFIIKKDEHHTTADTLALFIDADYLSGGGRIKEVIYSEPLKSIEKYLSIEIYAGNDLIARFREIEIMI